LFVQKSEWHLSKVIQKARNSCCAEFPAATVDYDADSDSMDDFSSGDDAPLDFLEFDADGLDLEAEAEAEAEPEEEENIEDGDDPLVASTSGEGPVIEMAGMPPW